MDVEFDIVHLDALHSVIDLFFEGVRSADLDIKAERRIAREDFGTMRVPLPLPLNEARFVVQLKSLGLKREYFAGIYLHTREEGAFEGLSDKLGVVFRKPLAWSPTHDDGRGYVLKRRDSKNLPLIAINSLADNSRYAGRVIVIGEGGAEPRAYRGFSSFSIEMAALQTVAQSYVNACIRQYDGKHNPGAEDKNEKITLTLDCL